MSDAEPDLVLASLKVQPPTWRVGGPAMVRIDLEVGTLSFDLDLTVELLTPSDGRRVHGSSLRGSGLRLSWLPADRYAIEWYLPRLGLAPGTYTLRTTLWSGRADATTPVDIHTEDVTVVHGDEAPVQSRARWQMRGEQVEVRELGWAQQRDQFLTHFDADAAAIAYELTGDSPLLRGRVLEVGCGDGALALSLATRFEPELLVALDHEPDWEDLLARAQARGIPLKDLPECLEFRAEDPRALPFEDDEFDLVVCWDSLSRLPGHLQVLREIKRVLRDGGMLVLRPGLYYHAGGHGLGKALPDFAHLSHAPEELREALLEGDHSAPEQAWESLRTRAPLRAGEVEAHLRTLEMDIHRAQLGCARHIEVPDALREYSVVDLALNELSLSAFNRKPGVRR